MKKPRGEESEKRREEKGREGKGREGEEERRSRCAKTWESRETLYFSNDLWPRRVEK
jgi:hypothetical protein